MNRAARHTPRGPWARIGRLGGYYSLKYYKGFDHLVANTEDIAEWIVGQGWPAGKVSCIPNFAAAPPQADAVDRASLATPPDVPLLLAMGRLHENKAHDVSLQALVQLPDAWLWIAGVGPLEAKLRGHGRGAGRRRPGPLPRLAHRRFGALPDGGRLRVPVPLRAAGQCGDPGLGPRPAGGRRRQPGAGRPDPRRRRMACWSPSMTPTPWPTGIRRLLADPALRARFAAAGAARVEAEFSETAVVGQWKALFADFGGV